MQVTERDLELLRCVNRFGFLTVVQVAKFWGGIDFSTAAARVRKLVSGGLLQRAELKHYEARPLVITTAGRKVAGDELPVLRGIRAATFQHDSMLFDLACGLERRFSARFETEREYRWRNPGRAEEFHLPDGVLHRESAKVGIELELTKKAPRRLREIVASHAGNLDFDEVWYVVTSEPMREYVHRIASDFPHIKIIKWSPGSHAAGQQGDSK